MREHYDWPKAGSVHVSSTPAADIDANTETFAIVIGNPRDGAHIVNGTIAELAAFAAKVSSAVRDLAPHAHLADFQLAEQLGDALLALDAPDEGPAINDDADPLDVVRELVTEAHDRLPADEFGPLCKNCAKVDAGG